MSGPGWDLLTPVMREVIGTVEVTPAPTTLTRILSWGCDGGPVSLNIPEVAETVELGAEARVTLAGLTSSGLMRP